MAKYDYKGVIHCHSTYSDGTGSMEEIAKAANEVGLDFVMMTDHDQMKPVKDGWERWHDSALIICGTEITPATNHYIAFGDKPLKDVEKLKALPPQEIINAVGAQDWFGFIAHPDHLGTRKFEIPSYRWDAWEATGYTGMGIWDLMTDWQAQLDRDDLSMEMYTEFEDWLTGPRIETLKRWDELNAKRKVVGIGEIDNHRYRKEYNGQTLEIFPYETAFKTICNHVLLDEPLEKDYKKAKKQILKAVRHGSLYISFDWWDDPTEFSFEIDNGEKVAGMGDEITLGEKTELVATFPQEGLLNVYCNGQSVLEEEGDEILLDISEPGTYRVEAMRNDIVWILSNAIYVKAPQA
ncbi:MAG TPA: CehA/McbA family metallohydrolase [Planctomycetota bacterium]|nr:CehA/McbA family metallohydrolase [Planctomycetota bacterium]